MPRLLNYEVPYLNQKLVSSGHGIVPYIVSEWNQTQILLDAEYSNAFMTNYVLEMEKHNIYRHVVAAWQDFVYGTSEFHQDYGMLSNGALHKPAWKSLLLLNKLYGNEVNVIFPDTGNLSVAATIQEDTLRILVSNYQLSPYIESVCYIFEHYKLNTLDFTNAGFTSDTYIDSVFRELITLPVTDTVSFAINQTIPYYNYIDSIIANHCCPVKV